MIAQSLIQFPWWTSNGRSTALGISPVSSGQVREGFIVSRTFFRGTNDFQCEGNANPVKLLLSRGQQRRQSQSALCGIDVPMLLAGSSPAFRSISPTSNRPINQQCQEA